MIKLLEPAAFVKVRKEDLSVAKSLLFECEKEYKTIMKKETERDYDCKLTVLDNEFFGPDDNGSCGGVILMSSNKKIVCSNTLNMRLDLCYEQLQPEIRKNLNTH